MRYPETDITNPGHGLVSQSRTWTGSIHPWHQSETLVRPRRYIFTEPQTHGWCNGGTFFVSAAGSVRKLCGAYSTLTCKVVPNMMVPTLFQVHYRLHHDHKKEAFMFTSFTGTQRPIFVDLMYRSAAPVVRYPTNSKVSI